MNLIGVVTVRPALVFAGLALLAAGCQSERPGGAMQIEVAAAPVSVLQTVNERAHVCWIRSGDRDFRGLAVIPELDTRTGNPRILIVERAKAQGLPRFVIEASGSSPTRIVTYGPLAGQALSSRVNTDVTRWAAGDPSCKSRA